MIDPIITPIFILCVMFWPQTETKNTEQIQEIKMETEFGNTKYLGPLYMRQK